ncbi:dephospho-CoA kinase [Mucilaginibacter agri]|uniref:Dephospho-CoA kinase n=1 Tax=Mucilaginibacter agri TaxID=2695265 RepID=A0A965ZF70_9SPHI|nr:dephospho-CoA kinase [Mucilaginibacter agri]NCD69795.1 dephospho-CoA kinase [Mucilaginibacter agri]
MLKIGLTGNIGSGKTTVSKVFEILGVPVFSADTAAKSVMTNDAPLIAGIKETFGNEAYFEDGSLNRKYIAGKVFNDPAELAKLNALVHPATFRAFDSWVKAYADVPYVIKEAAILFESGSYKLCDYSLIVTAPFEIRMQRVTERDHITMDEAKSRDARQMSEEEKLKLADFSIKNDDSELVIPQVLALHQQFLALANTK